MVKGYSGESWHLMKEDGLPNCNRLMCIIVDVVNHQHYAMWIEDENISFCNHFINPDNGYAYDTDKIVAWMAAPIFKKDEWTVEANV